MSLSLPFLSSSFYNCTNSGQEYFGIERHVWAWSIGLVFAVGALLWSLIGIVLHYQHNTNDRLRKHVLRVLAMVPVYSISAWFGLVLKDYTLFWDVARETYEAVTIYSFLSFLVIYLGGPEKLINGLAEKPQQTHLMPFNWLLRDWTMGADFYYSCRRGVLQYVYIRTINAFVTVILIYTGTYGDGEFEFDQGYIYIVFINNFSQIVAMYCLVLFYMATKDELAPINPLAKFTCIKAVVFFTFWQSLVIAGLVKINVLTSTCSYSVENVSAGLQDFIICIEMFIAAGAHWKSFPHDEFQSDEYSSLVDSENPKSLHLENSSGSIYPVNIEQSKT